MATVSIAQPAQGVGQILVRCAIIGVVYATTQMLGAALLDGASRLAPTWDNALVWTLTGALTCLALSPFIRRSSRPWYQTVLAIWAAMALVRSVGLGIEGALYVPATARYAPLGIAAGILTDLLIAWWMVQLLTPADAGWLNGERPTETPRRRGWDWTWRVLVVALAYIIFYFVFGSANALLYTLPFYRNNPQYGLTVPPMNAIFAAQFIRGPLFGLGALCLAWTTRAPRRQLAAWLGPALFVIGGAVPYLEAVFRTMPLGFNLATLTELLFQNVPTGVVGACLFADKWRRTDYEIKG